MALPIACPASTGARYRPLLSALHVTGDEEAQVLPILSHLDGLDGACEGVLYPTTYDEFKLTMEKIAGLNLSAQRRLELQNDISKHLIADDFSAFVSQPYHKVLEFLVRHPVFAEVVLPHIWPGRFWSDELEKMVSGVRDCIPEASEIYPKLVDILFDRSGLLHLNDLIIRAKRARTQEISVHDNAATVFLGQADRNAAFTTMSDFFRSREFLNWARVKPQLIGPLQRQRDHAESEVMATLLEKVGQFPPAIQADPLIYWMPLVKLASLKPELLEDTPSHYSVLNSLYIKARERAADEVMVALFDVEFAEYTGDPLGIDRLDQKILTVRKAISGVDSGQVYILPNGQTESGVERTGRYYSVIGHLLTRKYGVAISAMTPNHLQIAQIEASVEALLQERRDKTSVDEALVYADMVGIVASAWAAEGGLMTQRLMAEGLPRAREELTRLLTLLRRFETLCNGHYLGPDGDQLREKMADIRWKIYGETYFRAGLPKQGLIQLDSEAKKFQNTDTYAAHLRELARQYPWLVDGNGNLDLNHVGDHGREAVSITETLFYSSRNQVREVGLPVMGAVAGSLGGPLGSFVGGYAGKGINRLINSSTSDAREIVSQAEATGIPLISENLSEQLARSEYLDLTLCGLTSLLMFRFYRAGLSLTRGATQASYRFVASGGLRTAARTSVQHLSQSNFREAGSKLGSRMISGIRNFPAEIRAVPGNVVKTYGKPGIWPTVKYVWEKYGVRMRLTSSAVLLAADYFPDKKFNTWAGPLGASLLINDIYGKVVWGWNANAGMVGFVWRYGFELGVQAIQGIPITRPRMDYTVAGMLAAYTLRGINKLYTLGRAETHNSPILQRLAHFVEEHDVLVPRSVAGLTRIKARWGMVRGVVMRIGKPPRPLSAKLPDGTILRVEEVAKVRNGGKYSVQVVRKQRTPEGKAIEVVTSENGPGNVVEQFTEVLVPRASRLGRWMSRTVHYRLGDTLVYRVPDAVMRFFGFQPKKWVDLAQIRSTPDKPIFNFRGSLANSGDLPILGLVGGGFGLLQDSDLHMTGLYRAADYGIAFFFQHKVQHLLKIDGTVSTAVGYALGIPFSILSLPKIFPTVINQGPSLTKEGTGYFARTAANDDEGAAEALRQAVTSLCPVSNIPVFGKEVWRHVTPFGAITDSSYRIEETGAVTYWHKMLGRIDNSDIMTRFIDKVARDSQRYLIDSSPVEDPVRLRLLMLELAFVKRLMQDKNHPQIRRHANSLAVLKEVTPSIPTIRTESDLRQMITGLNINKRVGAVADD